ncbi:MAG: HAMP domain-containing histidine kinase [Deltaproteobacteria bacterium]|nr:HAMP domain-containing histidine kinase [Deltaproteobacteria bacterium]
MASCINYHSTYQTSATLIRARSIDLAMTIHHSLNFMPDNNRTSLNERVSDLLDNGIRYIALLNDKGSIIVSAGTTANPFTIANLPIAHHRPPMPYIKWNNSGDTVQVISALPRRGFRHRMMLNRWLANNAPAYLLFELTPETALAMQTRALITLIVSCAAALLLAAIALLSWRKNRQAEGLAIALSQDQHLKTLGQMSAVLSHELRNPLTALKGHAQLLLESLTNEHKGYLGAKQIVHEAKRLEELANQILDFARLGTINLAEANPEKIARAAIEAVNHNNIQLTVAKDLPSWQLDCSRIEQVMVNLIRNATQASPSNSAIEIYITHKTDYLIFSVRDHGPGINSEVANHIFDPFYTGKIQGTGLGLAIAKQIVTAHGGQIKGMNHPQGGAIFRVILPKLDELQANE